MIIKVFQLSVLLFLCGFASGRSFDTTLVFTSGGYFGGYIAHVPQVGVTMALQEMMTTSCPGYYTMILIPDTSDQYAYMGPDYFLIKRTVPCGGYGREDSAFWEVNHDTVEYQVTAASGIWYFRITDSIRKSSDTTLSVSFAFRDFLFPPGLPFDTVVTVNGMDTVLANRYSAVFEVKTDAGGSRTAGWENFDIDLAKEAGNFSLYDSSYSCAYGGADCTGSAAFHNEENVYALPCLSDTLYLKVLEVERNGWTFTMKIRFDTAGYTGAAVRPVVFGKSSLICKPNPFNPSTRIVFSSQDRARGEAVLMIFRTDGRFVSRQAAFCSGGGAEFSWDGRDMAGNRLGSGVYIGQVRAGERTAGIRLLLAK